MAGSERLEARPWPFIPWLAVILLAMATFWFTSAASYNVFLRLFHPELPLHGIILHHWLSSAARLRGPAFYDPVIIFPTVLIRSIATVIVIVGLRHWLGANFADLGFVRPSGNTLLLGALSGIALLIATILANNLDVFAFGHSHHTNSYLASIMLYHTPSGLLLILAPGALFTTVAEETLFRGIIFSGLRQRSGLPPAILLSAALFAAMHLDFSNFFSLMTAGVGLALVYHRYRTLWASIACHGTVNFIWILWAYVASKPH